MMINLSTIPQQGCGETIEKVNFYVERKSFKAEWYSSTKYFYLEFFIGNVSVMTTGENQDCEESVDQSEAITTEENTPKTQVNISDIALRQ